MKFLDSTGLGVLWNKIKANFYTKTETDTKLGTKQNVSDKVTSVTKESTDTEYPSAKAVYDAIEDYCAHDYSKDYLTFEALENGTFTFSQNALQYSLDGGTTWATLAANTATPTVTSGGTIMWKQTGLISNGGGIGIFSSSGNFNIYGNIMSLYYGDNFIGQISLTGKNNAFYNLFYNCNKLVNVSNLILPATTLAQSCYNEMFYGCTSLTTAPTILPATTLADACYKYMFCGCTSLTKAPALPATTLRGECYKHMFEDCTSLTSAPELPATVLAERCYTAMFKSCTSLTIVPKILPATRLVYKCYKGMFCDCTALVTTPELPATILAEECYVGMFDACESLTNVPKILPATTLANYCYMGMFYGCLSLKTAPELPATTLAEECYRCMFHNCSQLNHIKCLATNISASNCTYNWLIGVSQSGTFIKADNMQSWDEGDSGIPNGWKIYTDKEYEVVRHYEIPDINISTSPSVKKDKFHDNVTYQVLIPIDPTKNNYSGDSLSDITIIPYISNDEKYLALLLSGTIKEGYVIIESNLIGSGFYSNASILYNNGVVQIYPTLPLNLIKDNLKYLMISYYKQRQIINSGLYLWYDDYADGDYSISALNTWVEEESNTDASNWQDYVENYLFEDYPDYRGASCYHYINDTFEWEGDKYYLWKFVSTSGNGYDRDMYILTNTIDYVELNSHSLETGHTNHWCPYVVKFIQDGNEYTGADSNDILLKVTNSLPVIQDIWTIWNGYDDWDDYCEGFLLDAGTNYGQSNEYVYVGETFEWDGNEYYLWYENTFDYFILTDTIDYQDLYDMSIEANHYNMNCPYVAMLNVDQEFWYDGNERQNDWLIKVVEGSNNPGQAISLYIDDFVK